ncbi:MAG: phage tail sheath subtilisin-like domain-containing protein, partial [Candidatus Aminicenantes bacterium]|nr:phage tail sheath subtilisin-like domain-containing protein [Candidatus Aminicenantes bacterium]
ITAFIGRALKGEVNEPKTIGGFGDFERIFRGLHVDFPMSYAVRDFFLNGGSKAVIVRLFKKGAKKEKASITKDGLKLEAASEGKWGTALRIRIDTKVSEDVALRYGLVKADLFNLTVHDTKTDEREFFLNLSVKDSPRKIDRVLKAESELIRAATVPAAVPNAHPDPAANKTIWTDDNCWSKVAAADESDDGASLDKTTYEGSKVDKTGLYALEKVDLFNLLCIPPDTREGDTLKDVYQTAMKYCSDRRAMLIVDSPKDWKKMDDIIKNNNQALTDLGLTGTTARNVALFFPRIIEADALRNNQLDTFAPCGVIAGIFARTDSARGVWKAPAGLDTALTGIQSLALMLTDEENGSLNPLGVNCLRTFPLAGSVIWGSRTLRGADLLADEYKYIPVRRTALFIEESLYRGLKWVVFEPNDEPLWAQIRLNVGAFMHDLFRQGAFQGTTPREAYFVKCDKETTTQNDVDKGIVNIVVGFAPLKPAEFVIIKIQQMAGQLKV